MRAVIIAGGSVAEPDFYRGLFQEGDVVICADGGCRNAQRLRLVPDVVIGDFDSFPEQEAAAKKEKIVLPAEKDRTDSHECVCYAVEHGYDEILMLGATGTRLDHTLANIHLLKIALDAGVPMRICDEHNEIFLIQSEAVIPKRAGWHLSLLPVGAAAGIVLEGLYYPLCGAKMEFGNPYGVSNEFTEEKARVALERGLLLAILSRD